MGEILMSLSRQPKKTLVRCTISYWWLTKVFFNFFFGILYEFLTLISFNIKINSNLKEKLRKTIADSIFKTKILVVYFEIKKTSLLRDNYIKISSEWATISPQLLISDHLVIRNRLMIIHSAVWQWLIEFKFHLIADNFELIKDDLATLSNKLICLPSGKCFKPDDVGNHCCPFLKT